MLVSHKSGQDLDLTGLMGPDERKKADVREVSALYDFISVWTPAEEDIASFSSRVQVWIVRFCALSDRRARYHKANVTSFWL